MSNYRKLYDGAQYLGKWTYSCHIPPYNPSGDVMASHFSEKTKTDQRRMINAGVALSMSILLGIGLGVGLERGWTAMNAEVIEVAK